MNIGLLAMRSALLLAFLGICSAATRHAMAETKHRQGLPKRAVTVADAIEMKQIADRSYLRNLSKVDNVVQFSPDGRKFAFVTQQGDLKNDTVVYQLLVFTTAEAFAAAQPEVAATLASSSNREGISQIRWLDDNDTIAFLGEEYQQTTQLYKVSIRTKKMEQLTNHPTDILSFSMTSSGDSFVYVAETRPRPAMSTQDRRRGFFVTYQQWDDLYTDRRAFDMRREIFVKTAQMEVPEEAGGVINLNRYMASGLSISPNGQYALVRAYRTSPPIAWNEYQYKADYETGPSDACSLNTPSQCPEELLVVDLEKKTIEPLLNAPATGKIAGSQLAAWTAQSTVLLVNALLPLDPLPREERNRRLNHVYAAEVTLPERRILTISEREQPYPMTAIQLAPGDRLIVKPKLAILAPSLEFRKGVNGWTITEIKGKGLEATNALSVTLDQDINSPPTLVARNSVTKHAAVLLDLNPQFSFLTFGEVKIFTWKTHDGQPYEGTLYYPPDYVKGKRYPLIIQTHDERRERFWIDGPYTTAYAAQPLANRGFFVLQIGMADVYEKSSITEVYKILGGPQEGPHYTELFESAIDELDRRGLVDRTKVGLTGFSRTVYHVLYALTHSTYHFAAAVAADGVDFGYVDCVYYFASNPSICEKMNGGRPPFGDGLAGWFKDAPTFRLDKITAPLLLQTISAPLAEWELFAGLRWLKKPVELLNFYPEGEHILVKPQQRLLSQESVVDWYCFWLKGEEDPDPAKAAQYARWRQMKKQLRESAVHSS
jgi:dipeptidyl aminopeptidase/acylaminoacyl peptidase